MRGLRDGKVAPQDPFTFAGGAWVPWYTQHKILAGLRDAWVVAENSQAKDVALKLADWADEITSGLSKEQVQRMIGSLEEIARTIRRARGAELTFRTRGLSAGRPQDVTLRPFSELAYRHYNVYWTVAPPL